MCCVVMRLCLMAWCSGLILCENVVTKGMSSGGVGEEVEGEGGAEGWFGLDRVGKWLGLGLRMGEGLELGMSRG